MSGTQNSRHHPRPRIRPSYSSRILELHFLVESMGGFCTRVAVTVLLCGLLACAAKAAPREFPDEGGVTEDLHRTRPSSLVLDAIFDEAIPGDNVAVVRDRAAAMPDEEGFEYLVS